MIFLRYKLFFYFIFNFAYADVNAQTSALKSFKKLSRPEKHWVIFHPFIAKKTFHLTQKVLAVCDSLKKDTALDGDGNGGQLDAFRHCYWMAILTQHISAKKAYRLGFVHEKGNYIAFKNSKVEDASIPDSLSSVMDIINNQIGIEIGLSNKKSAKHLSDHDLIDIVKNELLKGKLRRLLKDEKRNFLTCEGEIIDPNMYIGKWSVPKCLVRSNVKPY